MDLLLLLLKTAPIVVKLQIFIVVIIVVRSKFSVHGNGGVADQRRYRSWKRGGATPFASGRVTDCDAKRPTDQQSLSYPNSCKLISQQSRGFRSVLRHLLNVLDCSIACLGVPSTLPIYPSLSFKIGSDTTFNTQARALVPVTRHSVYPLTSFLE